MFKVAGHRKGMHLCISIQIAMSFTLHRSTYAEDRQHYLTVLPFHVLPKHKLFSIDKPNNLGKPFGNIINAKHIMANSANLPLPFRFFSAEFSIARVTASSNSSTI